MFHPVIEAANARHTCFQKVRVKTKQEKKCGFLGGGFNFKKEQNTGELVGNAHGNHHSRVQFRAILAIFSRQGFVELGSQKNIIQFFAYSFFVTIMGGKSP